jgi:hypothetical protein
MISPDSAPQRPMATAPRDGSVVLVAVRASEQGAVEYDAVRFARSAQSGEEAWVAIDSDPDMRIAYAESELAFWLPLPTQLPELRSRRATPALSPPPDESDGSAI